MGIIETTQIVGDFGVDRQLKVAVSVNDTASLFDSLVEYEVFATSSGDLLEKGKFSLAAQDPKQILCLLKVYCDEAPEANKVVLPLHQLAYDMVLEALTHKNQ